MAQRYSTHAPLSSIILDLCLLHPVLGGGVNHSTLLPHQKTMVKLCSTHFWGTANIVRCKVGWKMLTLDNSILILLCDVTAPYKSDHSLISLRPQ